MTQAKAQTVIAAVVAAGLDATAHLMPDGITWIVTVNSNGFTIDSATVASFVSANAIVGKSMQVQLS